MTNIDCRHISFYPIGTFGVPFRGILDGGGYQVSNVNISKDHDDYVALFSATSGSQIFGLSLVNIQVTGSSYLAGLIGYASNTQITDTQVLQGQISSVNSSPLLNSYIGGLIGFAGSYATLKNCNVQANVIAPTGLQVGGLIGAFVGYNISIVSCSSSGSISSIGTQPTNTNVQGCAGGLVGNFTGFNGSITDSFSNSSVMGTFAGGLLGYVLGQGSGVLIQRNYATGSVTGIGFTSYCPCLGGLIGQAVGSVQIKDCYARGSVQGGLSSGGLTFSALSVVNSYATGLVIPIANSKGYQIYVGGLLGAYLPNQTCVNSYWDSQTTGQSQSAAGQGQSTSNMYKQTTYYGWDFTNIWMIQEGKNYPELRTIPQMIQNCNQLQALSQNLGRQYKLMNNLDCSNVINFIPIGTAEQPFFGNFDGSGFEIRNLIISQPGQPYIGLFGYTQSATISNLHLRDVQLSGDKMVGGLIGYAEKTQIVNISITGTIEGNSSGLVGGLVGGLFSNSTLSQSVSFMDLNIITADYVGGLVGQSSNSQIFNSYNKGNINGSSYVGGLIGSNLVGTITNTYSTGKVIATNGNGGGLCASNMGTIINSYWDMNTSGQTTSSGGVGKNTEDMFEKETYVDWDFNLIWNIVNGFTYSWLRAFEK